MKRSPTLALPLLIAAPLALASDPVATTTESPAMTDMQAQLVRYHWRLQKATDANGKRIDALFVGANMPLQLDFFADGVVLVRNACNDIGGDYTLNGNALTVTGGPSTLMACVDPKLMALDDEISGRLEGTSRLALSASDSPSLILVTGKADTLVFTGKLIGERMSIEVAAHTMACSHPVIPDKQCLQIRQVEYDDSDGAFDAIGPLEDFPGKIDGLEREDGVRYVLGVERFPTDNPRPDGPRYKYVLEWISQSDATGK